MGLYHTVYAGAAIKIPQQKEYYTRTKRVCIGNADHAVSSGDYCSICGSAVGNIDVQEERLLWSDELIGNERLAQHFEDDDMFLYSNLMDSNSNIQVSASTAIVFDKASIEEMIEDFKDMHAEDIKVLEQRIGAKVNINFFVLHDYS